jgi:diaminohydroxyphosphoribosylaminopyrimidine deaminase/5-amino-6-(5-phosphoribosylamino)uracil reductase
MSLDGRTAMASGQSQWITGPSARRDVQRLRAMSCAVVTGVGTVLADDCALSVRAAELGAGRPGAELAAARQPLRVVLDSSLRTPASARVLQGGATLVCHAPGTQVPVGLARSGAELAILDCNGQGLDLVQLMAELSARQCNEILVESGARLAGALLRAGLLDELIVYMAPALLGDRARPLLNLPLDDMADKVRLHIEDVRRVGQDLRFIARPVLAG